MINILPLHWQLTWVTAKKEPFFAGHTKQGWIGCFVLSGKCLINGRHCRHNGLNIIRLHWLLIAIKGLCQKPSTIYCSHQAPYTVWCYILCTIFLILCFSSMMLLLWHQLSEYTQYCHLDNCNSFSLSSVFPKGN